MLQPTATFPLPLPDDPRKWDGWSRYNSPNPYERLCLDPRANPSNELIEEHFRTLLLWWQKKLPLKNQPSNPLAQLLRSGLDESSRFLTEARVELLDPERREQVDAQLAAEAEQEALAEFNKYLAFALSDKTLTPQEEESLLELGRDRGLSDERMLDLIETGMERTGAARAMPPSADESVPTSAAAAEQQSAPLDPNADFLRMLRLSGLDADDMTDDQRDAFINMAENLGIAPSDAEDMVDLYLDEIEARNAPPPPPKPSAIIVSKAPTGSSNGNAVSTLPKIDPSADRAKYPNFVSSIGVEMLLVPSGVFEMGSEQRDAAPNERPLTQVTLSRYYIARHPITNVQYEMFDPSHLRKRMLSAGDRHPVVYVSSSEAAKFCQWLSARERRRYRLPTEAEWEYAARGSDGRRYPWGSEENRGDLANFADRNTSFAWSDSEIDDGFAETAPIGSFPRGASPFGVEDMAGNIWEWCSDFLEAYKGKPKVNPRGANSGAKRVYRGGSWKSRFNSLRATTRGANVPSFSCNDLGFRVVCECE